MINTFNQIINELARGNDKDIEKNSDIIEANRYLQNPKKEEKPKWLNDFLEQQNYSLQSIICRASGEKELLITNGYSESYFNEIVQNANDLHAGKEISIEIKEKNEAITVKCTYSDKGFKIQDIYGFCNTGMSLKGNDETGKFGIGIKSLFSFVDRIDLTGNIIIGAEISNEEVKSNVVVNNEWNNSDTVLEFSFCKNRETSFNISKLILLSHILNQENTEVEDKLVKLFCSGTETELLFDVFSLIFTDAQKEPSIEKIVFNNKVILECLVEKSNDTFAYLIKEKTICIKYIEKVLYRQKVILFNDVNESKMIFGFNTSNDKNRIYSVYYLRQLQSSEILNMGLYIHTPYTNSSRTDIANNAKVSTERIKTIRNNLACLMYEILSAQNDEISDFSKEISEIFHKCLNVYSDEAIFLEDKLNSSNIFYKCIENSKSNEHLQKFSSQNGVKKYVVVESEDEPYKRRYFPYEDKDIESELPKVYKRVVEQDDVAHYIDICSEDNTLSSVKDIYKNINNKTKWVKNLLNYYDSVANFIRFRIASNENLTGEKIGSWLKENSEIGDGFLLKLLGRYKIVEFINEYGCIIESRFNFVDYLFSQKDILVNNSLGKSLVNKFHQDYSELKIELLKTLVTDFKYYEPTSYSLRGWQGDLDYEANGMLFINENLLLNRNEKMLYKIIEILYNDNNFHRCISMVDNKLVLFPCDLPDFKYRDKYWEYSCSKVIKALNLDFLRNIRVTSVADLKLYQEAVDKLYKDIRISCNLEKIEPTELEKLITWLINRKISNFMLPIIGIKSIEMGEQKNECDDKKRIFIQMITDYNVFQMPLMLDSMRGHVVAYIKDGSLYIKFKADKTFEKIDSMSNGMKLEELFVYYNENIKAEIALNYVLEHLNVSNDAKELINGYIPLKSIGESVNPADYENIENNQGLTGFKIYRVIQQNKIPIDVNVQKKLLLARGSYNGTCPICGKRIKDINNANIFTIPNEIKYIKGISCKECNQLLKKSLTFAEYYNELGELHLYCKYYVGEYQSKKKQIKIKLSYINKLLMDSLDN